MTKEWVNGTQNNSQLTPESRSAKITPNANRRKDTNESTKYKNKRDT